MFLDIKINLENEFCNIDYEYVRIVLLKFENYTKFFKKEKRWIHG